jgi:uracil-DNA glycosylase family 4
MADATQVQITAPFIVTERRRVPNYQPLEDPGTSRIAIVGEAPGEVEENYNQPFAGPSGQLLNNVLYEVGLDRNKCFVGNVCQTRPPGNRLCAFAWNGPEIQSGIEQLSEDLAVFNPTIIVALGATPLHVLRCDRSFAPKPGKETFSFPHSITAWRGSLFLSPTRGSWFQTKSIASLHPAYVLREFSGMPLLKFDLQRTVEESRTKELLLPQREIITSASASLLCYVIDTWPSNQKCYMDIEGGLPINLVHPDEIIRNKKKPKEDRHTYGWPCVGLAARPSKAYVIRWNTFSVEEHVRVLRSFARLMWRTDVPKVLQNQLYDNFVLSYGYRCPIRNVSDDTMISGWEIFSELPRGLSTQASIWTRQPHWKDDSMYESDGEGLAKGCGVDCCVTAEISQGHLGVLESDPTYATAKVHYKRIIAIQRPFLYMQLRGIRYDSDKRKKLQEVNANAIAPVAQRLREFAGYDIRGAKGSISSQRLVKALYLGDNAAGFRYPPQYKKEKGRKTDKLTADVEALLTLNKHFPNDPFLADVLLHRHLEGIRETLNIQPDSDGRVRCGYSLEAETGRVKCYTSPTGSGANLQTIQKSLRELYCADPGHDFFQCDLEGADGWTVAARCAALGDSTMLDDYLAGMKPAKLIALMYYFGPVINLLSRPDLKWLHDNVFPIVIKEVGKWLYMGCKRVQHGSNYLMGIPTMQFNVLRDSYKESGTPIYLLHSDAKTLQDLYFTRYRGIKLWHAWAEAELVAKGILVAASGQVRVFFGRRFGQGLHETLKEFLAHEPQANTTFVTNMAMQNLWDDFKNRRPSGALRTEPLHQVHDALCGQWPCYMRDWATQKMRGWFHNPINIAGLEIVIPFDGGYGPTWRDTKTKI